MKAILGAMLIFAPFIGYLTGMNSIAWVDAWRLWVGEKNPCFLMVMVWVNLGLPLGAWLMFLHVVG